MTSKGDSLKTNEFLRLRKLRLQQVREQSKDIAKKIRQRAKVEQLRQVSNIDTNKEKEYLQRQEKLVNRLEQLYSKSLQNVGASHKKACEVNETEIPEKKDLSKSRGREAAAVLKRKKQEKLDEQKRLLDRKLHAREVANELSREKFAAVANTVTKSASAKSVDNEANAKIINVDENAAGDNVEIQKDKSDPIAKNDMGTQWEFEEIPNEWEPNIPRLPIPHDDSIKNSANDNVETFEQSRKNRRLNLFALSDEMPSSLRGGVTSIPDERLPVKPSLTLVSEYLQNRGLRLREPDTTRVQKKNLDDLQSIKQTLLRTRASRTDGSVFPNICHVLDEQVIPMPYWKAEKTCEFCSQLNAHNPKNYTDITKHNKISVLRPDITYRSMNYEIAKPYSKCQKCHQGLKIPVSGKSNEHCSNSGETNRPVSKKNSVTVYDHTSRDTWDLPQNVDKFVVRDQSNDEDAYSQAVKEASVLDDTGKSRHTAQQEERNRLAVTRQNVDKDYRDTLAFLNSLPKEKPARCIRTAYMDGDREQEMKDKRQQKLQQEFKKIEKQSSKHQCKHTRNKPSAREQNRSKSKSPVTLDNNVINRDFQYSWLPIPESDASMAIHTIPNTTKDNKSGNTVKFSSVDTYHEYRSRHKHTPPTKDIDNEPNKRVVEAVIIHENSNESADSSFETDTSSVENMHLTKDNTLNTKVSKGKQLDDADRIIIYKVMESKKSKNKKHKLKRKSSYGNNVEPNNDGANNRSGSLRNLQNNTNRDDMDKITTNTVSFTQLQEGIYKNVTENGDNITSLYFSDDQQTGKRNEDAKNPVNGEKDSNDGTGDTNGDKILNRKPKPCVNCKKTDSHNITDKRASAATSTSSFKSAVNEKANVLHDDGYIKFVDEGGNDTRKFYVGASGFLKDDAYEVIIQLRKKEADRISNNVSQDKSKIELRTSSEHSVKEKNNSRQEPIAVPSINEPNNPLNNSDEVVMNIIAPQEKPSPPSAQNNIEMLEQVEVLHENVDTPEKLIAGGFKESTVKVPEIAENGVSTTFRDSYAIPDDMPKSDPIPRPVTSIYTQTTPNSSFHRPILMHLSSSTSTTYMSPPELILPRYLRKEGTGCDDMYMYEPVSVGAKFQNIRSGFKVCKCGKCKKQKKEGKADTPPNTSRSSDQTTDNHISEKPYKKCASRHKHIRPHKCKERSDPKICSKQKFKRSPSENKRLHSGSNYSNQSQSVRKRRIINNFDKVNLSPVIEGYVKRLLALNKEGLKAIEIVNQECSVVNTPGSSVIDVSSNINKNKPMVCNKISLEQIKRSFEEQILKNIANRKKYSKFLLKSTGSQTEKNIKMLYKCNKKRPVHKVKSFNISKQFLNNNKERRRNSGQSTVVTTSPCSVSAEKRKTDYSNTKTRNQRNEKSPTSRQINTNQAVSNYTSNSESSSKKTYKSGDKIKSSKTVTKINTDDKHYQSKEEMHVKTKSKQFTCHKATRRSQSSESETSNDIRNRRNLSTPPISISTQTNQVDSEIEFMKLAENKLQNMEKIADLTEKCTKRLSNLAKVLEEVRRNKSLAYSQVSTSDCTSDTEQRSDKNMQTINNRANTFNHTVEIQTLPETISCMPTSPHEHQKNDINNAPLYIPILMDLPKPETFKTPLALPKETNNSKANICVEQQFVKNRGKPPPALNRINLKNVPEGFVVPHELSTVVEVDSPMSIKVKSHTTQIDKKEGTANEVIEDINLKEIDGARIASETSNKPVELNELMNKFNTSRRRYEVQSTDTSQDSAKDSKVKMMDLKYFNEIMLKPFISLKDFAKQFNLDDLNGQNSFNGVAKDENANEELSSLHSESSIPDVVAELLKRNLISEPFKFETTSNVNSTTVSSESTLSLLALSRAHKDKKKSAMVVKNKENIAETSVSLSLSSNPDLEHAFQRLGMGWASSTLKKTKERLALSSSSNTSSSSLPQFKMKSFNYQDIPELSSLLNISNKEENMKPQLKNFEEIPKNALQQTSLTNSMTVKEFLTNELASKITFAHKTNRNTTDEEFISLYETKMPEEMKRASAKPEIYEKSADSLQSGANNRARTSTPVQIFKSMAYHSSSSSNTSNGLFSNADDLSSVKGTSNSMKNHSVSDKDELTIPNYSLKIRNEMTECNKSD